MDDPKNGGVTIMSHKIWEDMRNEGGRNFWKKWRTARKNTLILPFFNDFYCSLILAVLCIANMYYYKILLCRLIIEPHFGTLEVEIIISIFFEIVPDRWLDQIIFPNVDQPNKNKFGLYFQLKTICSSALKNFKLFQILKKFKVPIFLINFFFSFFFL